MKKLSMLLDSIKVAGAEGKAPDVALAEIKVGDVFTDDSVFYEILALNKSTAKIVALDHKAKPDGYSNGSTGNSSGTKTPTNKAVGDVKTVRLKTVFQHGRYTTGFISNDYPKRYATRWDGKPIGYDHYS